METVNSILAAKKFALGYGKKEDVSKVSFIKDIYQSAVEHQSREIEKAIINQSSLTSTLLLKYGEIRHVTRNRYNAFVRDLNLDDIKVKKVINSSF